MRLTNAIRASRANGALSRGPTTDEGKRRSSLNALRHGLLAKGVVLKNESEDVFAGLVGQLALKLKPADDAEQSAIEEMASSVWRLRRLWAIEKRLLDKGVARSTQTDEADRIAEAFVALSAGPELHLLDRYESRVHRMYQRALHNFLILREFDAALPENNQTNLDSGNGPAINSMDG